MARPKPDMPPKAAILALTDPEGQIEVRVTPSASADTVALATPEGPLAVRTTAPPEDGKANSEVLKLLSKALDRPVSSLELVRGATSRNKLIRLRP